MTRRVLSFAAVFFAGVTSCFAYLLWKLGLLWEDEFR